MKRVVVIDGRSGRTGQLFIERVKAAQLPCQITAIGNNAIATTAMLKAGAEVGATGENPVVVACRTADVIAGPIGILAARKRGSITDTGLMVLSQLGVAIPNFWFGMLLVLLFSVTLRWLPPGGFVPWGDNFLGALSSLILPSLALALPQAAILARVTRTALVDVQGSDYIRTARAKGLPENKVIYHHAFRNTLIPLVTMLGGSLPGLFAGALITETLYSIPGIGYVSYQSMVTGDIPFSMFYLVFMAILTLLGNLISDILYAVVDPRVRIA
jgi:peptide/nickel transport system permease protein